MNGTFRRIGFIALAAIMAIGFVACGDSSSGDNSSPPHTHSYSADWKTNATQHWHECSCGDKADIASHTFAGAYTVTSTTYPATSTQACSCGVTGNPRTTEVGNTGPGGGKIFYIATSAGFDFFQTATDNVGIKAYYLEAAPTDMPSQLAWASSAFSSTDITGTSMYIGTGKRNTDLILVTDEEAPAASACAAPYSAGGIKTDWFLPSINELNELYKVKEIYDNWGTDDLYRSSTQRSSPVNQAYIQNFSTGSNTGNYGKGTIHSVRAIRAF